MKIHHTVNLLIVLAAVSVAAWGGVRITDTFINGKTNKELLFAMKRVEVYTRTNIEKVGYMAAATPRIGKYTPGVEAFLIAETIWRVSEMRAASVGLPVKDFAEIMEALCEHESGFKENAVNPSSGIVGPWQVSYSLAKALRYDPVIAAGEPLSDKTELKDWERSAPYAAAAFCLFYESANRNLEKTFLYWHDGEPNVDRGIVSPQARYLAEHVLSIIRRNKEMEKVS